MTPIEKAEEAMHKLVLAMIKRDNREINKWKTRVDYWTHVVQDLELKNNVLVSKTDVVRWAAKEAGVEVKEHKIIDPYVDYSITQKIEYLIGHGYGSGEELLDYLEGRDVPPAVAASVVNVLRNILAKEDK